MPFELAIFIGTAKFTPGRMAISLLFLPAVVMMCRKGRHPLLSDLFAALTAVWIIYSGSATSVPSSVAEALEFFGGYIVARGYFFERLALESFVRVLKVVTIALVVLGLADTLSGQFIAHNVIAKLVGVEPPFPQYREGLIRATATLDHPILYGMFCALASAIFLYSERNLVQRLFFVGLCLFGCISSLSSAAILGFLLVISVYCYDQLLKRYSWRWMALSGAAFGFVALVFLVSNHPAGWLVSHLTLDPQTGYYRIMIWDIAISQLALSPMTGFGFGFVLLNDQVLDHTVDSVWLVTALRFGIPIGVLLLLTNIAAFIGNGKNRLQTSDPYMDQLRIGFTLVLTTFVIIGLTVHYWNYMWIFWGLCIGIRASLREQSLNTARRPVHKGLPGRPPLLSIGRAS